MLRLEQLKQRARELKREVFALFLAARHPRTPWYAKVLLIVIVAYAVSPIDLIPDFVPVLGLLDDVILLPLGIALALKMIPRAVIEECRGRVATSELERSRLGRFGAIGIGVIWAALLALVVVWGLSGACPIADSETLMDADLDYDVARAAHCRSRRRSGKAFARIATARARSCAGITRSCGRCCPSDRIRCRSFPSGRVPARVHTVSPVARRATSACAPHRPAIS